MIPLEELSKIQEHIDKGKKIKVQNEYLEQNKEVTSTTTNYGTGILICGLNFPSKSLNFQVDLLLMKSSLL